jgi:hypothetical protein
MKFGLAATLLIFIGALALATESRGKGVAHGAKPAFKPAPKSMAKPTTKPVAKIVELQKTPKSLFLIKKIKISPDVGEPQFSPEQAQLRTVINDPVLHNYKKFE